MFESEPIFERIFVYIWTQVGFFFIVLSAGVGRTGTFIGLDSLLKQGKETGKINVFEFVKQMREDRMTMVQTPVNNHNFKKQLNGFWIPIFQCMKMRTHKNIKCNWTFKKSVTIWKNM